MDEQRTLSPDKLVALCERVEALCPGGIAGLTICDLNHTRIERALFPSLPSSFAESITDVSLVPSDFGSCVQAIARREIITCGDIENDRFFDPVWRKVCLNHGLKAIQSRPIMVHGKPRGTFVLAFRDVRRETDWDAALMAFAADAAGEALVA